GCQEVCESGRRHRVAARTVPERRCGRDTPRRHRRGRLPAKGKGMIHKPQGGFENRAAHYFANRHHRGEIWYAFWDDEGRTCFTMNRDIPGLLGEAEYHDKGKFTYSAAGTDPKGT